MVVIFNVILIIIVLLIAVSFVRYFFWRKRLRDVNKKHVVVTGGSSGIGKCVAILAAKCGAHVTIIARDVHKI